MIEDIKLDIIHNNLINLYSRDLMIALMIYS